MNPNNVGLSSYEVLAHEIIKRVLSDENESELRQWIMSALIKMGGSDDDDAVMTLAESIDFTNKMIEDYERLAKIPKKDRKILDFPWRTWNKLIDELEPGIMITITAPDGQGKGIVAESITEHWAENKNKVAYVHYELNKVIMMQRRTARHSYVPAKAIKAGNLFPEEKQRIYEAHQNISLWAGNIYYVHTPGWTIDRTIDELRKLREEKGLDAVVIDYLEKIAPSPRQVKMYGTNNLQREADNVEQLKNFAESTGIPVLMVAQMNKQGKTSNFDDWDSTDMTGTAEKSNKSNVIVLLGREKTGSGYSDEVNVFVAKNTMGATGKFKQTMIPQYFKLEDTDEIIEEKIS